MYTIRTTPGFIIHSKPYGEAGKILSIFTRDFGLVMATAQGIRLEKSKLRYHTLDYSFGNFSLVKGKEFWRLTSAFDCDPATFTKGDDISFVGHGTFSAEKVPNPLTVKMASLLKRLLHGEEAHAELFDRVLAAISFLQMDEEVNEVQMKTLESFTVLHMLHALGYVGSDVELKECLGTDEISRGLLDSLKSKRGVMNQHINKALRESQL